MNLILNFMEDAGNRVNIVVLDACRDNPYVRKFRSSSRGLGHIEAAKGMFIGFATAPGSVAADGTGRNGLYTEHLLASLKHPDGDIDKVFRRVAAQVSKATREQQVPWVSSSLTGDFYFRTPVVKGVDDARVRQIEQERADLAKEVEKLRAELQNARVASISVKPPQGAPRPVPAAPEATKPEPRPLSKSAAPASESAVGAQADWSTRVAALENLAGQLTFAKALALLFDITGDDALGRLVSLETETKRLSWHSAYALGTTANGGIVRGRSWKWGNTRNAEDAALSHCKGDCKVVMVNGEFREKEFIAFARALRGSLPAVRRSLLTAVAVADSTTTGTTDTVAR